MKSFFQLYYSAVCIAGLLFVVSCNNNSGIKTIDTQDSVATAQELKRETKEYSETRRDNVEVRANKLANTVEDRLQKIDRALQDENLSDRAILKLDTLRQNLKRLAVRVNANGQSLAQETVNRKNNLLDSLSTEVEQMEEELKKINKNLNNWFEKNIDQAE
ncbi:MAG: hypothetical protein U5L96_17320 [Owenweeksia sp.]|nr:hypothetical protein [Owenweeksia sp.]